MVSDKSAGPTRFVTSVLPWLAGAGGLLVYTLTLNYWVSLYSLGTVARVAGWLWRPEINEPLTLATYYPFRVLPTGWMPAAMNLFTAVCASAVLVNLARTVALLPHDTKPFQPAAKREPRPMLATPTAWIPSVLAVVVCGFELSFWEHATSASGEMLDLLVFACVLRCVVEFRLEHKQSWLSRAALVYGLGLANSWLMWAYLPVFIFAVLGSKRLGRFLKVRFLARMTLWGLAGMSLYLLLPALHSLAGDPQMSFWSEVRAHLRDQKAALSALRGPVLRILALTSLIPLLVLSIRWKSHTARYGDDNRIGIFLIKSTGHFVHASFFLLSLWITLDPSFSPRHLNLPTPLLPYYYLAALGVGYCTGYFLLLGSQARHRSRLKRWAARSARALAVAVPVLFLSRNFGQIWTSNGPALHDFARALYADLPEGRCVALSDEPLKLLLVETEQASHHGSKEPLLLDARALGLPEYHRFMRRRFEGRWPVPERAFDRGMVEPARQVELLCAFAAREHMVCLHPSLGPFFERFFEEPHGTIQKLESRGSEGARANGLISEIAARKPEPGAEAANEEIWQRRWTNGLTKLASNAGPSRRPRAQEETFSGSLKLQSEENATLRTIRSAYGRCLNDWGVELQRTGHWDEAGVWFERAANLSSRNLAARINLEYNRRRQQGQKERLDEAAVRAKFAELFANRDNWREVVGADGPVDEPTFLFRTGRMLLAHGNGRQAAEAFLRCTELAPEWQAPKLWVAQSCLRCGDFAAALDWTQRVDRQGDADPRAVPQLLYCRATALQHLGRTNEATAVIQGVLKSNQDNPDVLAAAAEFYSRDSQFGPELGVLDDLLARNPNQPELLARKGLAELELGRYEAADATLTRALLASPGNDDVRLQRAVARLGAGQLEPARQDYLELLKRTNSYPKALFGLATIAWEQKDASTAIRFYERYLSNAVPGQVQYTIAVQRLKQLKGTAGGP